MKADQITALETEARAALVRCAAVDGRKARPSSSCVPLLAQGVLDLLAMLRAKEADDAFAVFIARVETFTTFTLTDLELAGALDAYICDVSAEAHANAIRQRRKAAA